MDFSLTKQLNRNYTWQNLSVLFIAAFLLRALTFSFYVQHEGFIEKLKKKWDIS
jgi:uncharacterized membrane protein